MYKKGNKVNVKITNITPYGAFCRAEKAGGLIHISEISDYFVRDIRGFLMLVMKLKLRY
ncbi:S1 RNA-binding domain-containing protein [Spiroplasma endosymbiont of Seladonia tumulorum]|uniref:S1 RNA-binding domain-containing protein n=1 Tax=Spiroplasma endosymbiont of Seladonia tumulorum TaxID=3066321 RepID=UPI0030D4776F